MSSTTLSALSHAATTAQGIKRVGLWLFILSETFLFAALISSRYYLRGLERPEEVNQALGLALTVILLASSLTAYRAETAMAHGNRSVFFRNILGTIALGLLFLIGVGYEWAEAFHHFPPDTGFGTLLFTLTGVHAFHVFSGVVILFLVFLAARRGAFGAGDYWGVEGGVKYWHFVDVAWVFIYPTLYLVSG
jgi:cytochrome c oxidase subunit 3